MLEVHISGCQPRTTELDTQTLGKMLKSPSCEGRQSVLTDSEAFFKLDSHYISTFLSYIPSLKVLFACLLHLYVSHFRYKYLYRLFSRVGS